MLSPPNVIMSLQYLPCKGLLNYNKQNLRRRFGWLGGDEVYVNAPKIRENLDGWFLLWQLQVNDEKLKGDISTLV